MFMPIKDNMIKIKDRLWEFDKKRIMGIINLTPDSFYDGGKLQSTDKVLLKAEKMLKDGAEILDIGGYSSRPGASQISVTEELNRVIPSITAIVRAFPEAVLSIDTFRHKVAQKALDAGCSIVNDITAGQVDPEILDVVREYNCPYIIMHMQGSPENMQKNPQYKNVSQEILSFFTSQIERMHSKGIKEIIIDPGFGFGKSMEHNYTLLRQLSLFKRLHKPILVGLSRKSMIYKVLKKSPEEALNGTSVLNTLALINGADILRVHDVKEGVEAIKLVDLYLESSKYSTSF
jgi:dihydropteroate synthase